jgi:hypothetical protein
MTRHSRAELGSGGWGSWRLLNWLMTRRKRLDLGYRSAQVGEADVVH